MQDNLLQLLSCGWFCVYIKPLVAIGFAPESGTMHFEGTIRIMFPGLAQETSYGFQQGNRVNLTYNICYLSLACHQK